MLLSDLPIDGKLSRGGLGRGLREVLGEIGLQRRGSEGGEMDRREEVSSDSEGGEFPGKFERRSAAKVEAGSNVMTLRYYPAVQRRETQGENKRGEMKRQVDQRLLSRTGVPRSREDSHE